jgi:hypothetical protein
MSIFILIAVAYVAYQNYQINKKLDLLVDEDNLLRDLIETDDFIKGRE